MDSKEIIKNIEKFFQTADEKTLAKVNEAFSVNIDGDITVEEYLSGFGSEYFYTEEEPTRNVKVRSSKAVSRGLSVRYSK